MDVWLFGVLALVGLFIVINFFSLSIKLLWNGIVGMILLWLFNMVGSIAGLHLQINAVTALVAGFFGVPGVILMLLYQMLM
jgi:inhibitor of the pro-sigma K processing machinery